MKSKEQLKHEQLTKQQMEEPDMFEAPVTAIPEPPQPLDQTAATFFYKAAARLLETGRLTVIGTYYLATICTLLAEVQQNSDFFTREYHQKKGMRIPEAWPESIFAKMMREQRFEMIQKYATWMGTDVQTLEKAGLPVREIVSEG